MAKNLGNQFDAQFVESLKPLYSAGARFHKLHTPAAPADLAFKVLGWIRRLVAHAAELREGRMTAPPDFVKVPEWIERFMERSKFTPPQPYDLIISAPVRSDRKVFNEWAAKGVGEAQGGVTDRDIAMGRAAAWAAWQAAFESPAGVIKDEHGAPYRIRPQTTIELCLELKTAGAGGKSLPFSALKSHQSASLEKAEAVGRVAGVVIEFPPANNPETGVPDDILAAEVYFIPISTWRGLERGASRKSIPIDACRECGVRIEIDAKRGRVNRYYDVARFLEHFGAVLQ